MVPLLIIAFLFITCNGQQYKSCKFTIDGVEVDLSPLVSLNGSFSFIMASPDDQFPNKTYYFEMQFCEPVISQYPELCDKDPRLKNSVINRIDYPITNESECVSLGRYDVMAYNATPSTLSGVTVYYYFGTFINHITSMNSAVYLECNEAVEMSIPIYRHYRIGNDSFFSVGENSTYNKQVGAQAHFNIQTRHACHANTSGPGIVEW